MPVPPQSENPASNFAIQPRRIKGPPKFIAARAQSIIDPQDFPNPYREHIRKLGYLLMGSVRVQPGQGVRRPAKRNPSILAVWKEYLLSRNGLLSAPASVPRRVWEDLWVVFEKEAPNNRYRMAHIKTLGDDMSSLGILLQPPQRLLYIEAVYAEGDFDQALKQWKEALPSLANSEDAKPFWQLGVRVFCRLGQLGHALQTAKQFLQGNQDPTAFRILLPIIRAYLESKNGESVQSAWALYIRLRVNMGMKMNMEDYDMINSVFMAANRPDLALGAFRDMMLTGDDLVQQKDSIAQYKAAIDANEDFRSVEIQANELKWNDSGSLTKLPTKFRNRYFFGSWIKKLIGEKKLDAAKKVFELAQERQITPDAKHMNGLIGAWYRLGDERHRRLADEMAWKMIRTRLDFVKARDQKYNLELPLRVVETKGLVDNKSVLFLPKATIETFSILVQQYRQRQKPSLMSDIFDALKQARVKPDAFFMNQLLLTDKKAKHTSQAWETYLSLTKDGQVKPDFETYDILWNLMKSASNPVLSHFVQQARTFTTCRQLFAEMVKRMPTLPWDKNRHRAYPFPRDLYESIILCFSLTQDQAGTAVALRALQRYYKIFPSEETARTVVLQLARLGFEDEIGNKPIRLKLDNAKTKERVANVTKILSSFKARRTETLSQRGIVFAELRDDEKLEESLLLMSDLLRYAAQAKIAGEKRHNYDAATASIAAAEQMNATECAVWASLSGSDAGAQQGKNLGVV